MISSTAISLPATLSAAQRGLFTYMGTWSQLSLSQARLNPFSTRNLPESMQEGIATGQFLAEGMEAFSASAYMRRAATYESALLVSLGVDAGAIDSFVSAGVSYGDYFAEPLHPWQEEARFAAPVIRQMTELHEAIALARERISLWKRSGFTRRDLYDMKGKTDLKDVREVNEGTFHILREELGLDRILGGPLIALHGILERNVGRARWVIDRRGMTEEGLLEYFRIPHGHWSGRAAYEEQIDFAALETVFPPPVS